MKIMLSAGEVSGDLHGAQLAGEILKMKPDTELVGFGGDRMEEQGVRLWKNFKSYNVMGIVEVLKNLPRLLQLLNTLSARMQEERPDLLVLIDYPDFNWRLAKRARKLGIPVFSYIPPSAWAWRRGRAKACAGIADEFVSIFPFELEPYLEAGAKISFLGNPLVDKVKAEIPLEQARSFFGVPEEAHPILLLPGSRKQEIERLLPVMLKAARLLLKQRADTVFLLPVADGADADRIKTLVAQEGVPVQLAYENRYALMGIADAAMATSGTVVMEAALMQLPCVVLYKMSGFNYRIGKALVHIDNISLPNILLGRRAQAELFQEEAQPERAAEEMRKLYRGCAHRENVIAELAEASRRLGKPGAAKRIAERILEAAKSKAAEENYEKL